MFIPSEYLCHAPQLFIAKHLKSQNSAFYCHHLFFINQINK
ncbi:hypothetical protein pb186bvf_012958 [Paramecium bursaria]